MSRTTSRAYSISGLTPQDNTDYRVRFEGDSAQNIQPSSSVLRRLNVKVVVTLNTAETNLKLGDARKISGSVVPEHGGAVTVLIKRNGDLIAKKSVSLNSY